MMSVKPTFRPMLNPEMFECCCHICYIRLLTLMLMQVGTQQLALLSPLSRK